MNIQAIKALRGEVLDAATALVDGAEKENRNLNEEEKTQYDGKMKEAQEMEERIDRLEKLAQKEVDNMDVVVTEVRDSKNEEFRSFGDFLSAVAKADMGHGVDPRLAKQKEERQMGLNEGVPAEGGFLVKTDFVEELLRRSYELGALASRVRKIPVSSNANGLTINAVNETSRATGSRWGGVQAFWLHEAGTKTARMPEFRQMELKLRKLIGLCYATDELLQDTSALESIVTQAFSEEFAWMLDNAIFRGNGANQPAGITGHASTVVVNPEAGQVATTILYENIVNMWSRMYGRSRANAAWFINQDIEPQLFTMSLAVGVGGVPVYMPAGGASASPFGTLMGRPVIPIEQASTLGTVGDITLADMSQYIMIDKGGMQSNSSIHVRFVNDETAFRFVYRVDGQPAWSTVLTPANGTNTLSPFVQLLTR